MNNKDLLKETVVHKTFGEGTIKKIVDNYIEIEFLNGKTSKFSYPSCFDKFIALKNQSKQDEVLKELHLWKATNGIFEKEALRQITADRQEEIKQREAEREIRRLQIAKEQAERNKRFLEPEHFIP